MKNRKYLTPFEVEKLLEATLRGSMQSGITA
jgi:hypothetical protein